MALTSAERNARYREKNHERLNEYARKFMREKYRANPQAGYEQSTKKRLKVQAEAARIKAEKGCADCQSVHTPNLLEFHHPGGVGDEGKRVSQIQSMAALNREVEKTVVLCRPCHIKRHASA